MNETTIWLVRHAETENPHVFNGAESDVGLSTLGVLQAAAGAKWFQQHKPTAVVSSIMKRAVDTAKPIAELCGIPHHTEPALHERRVGDLAGTPFTLVGGAWTETLKRWESGEDTYTTPGAESFAEIRERTLTAFQRVLDAHAGGRIVVVAHGVVCKVLLLSLLPGHSSKDWSRIGLAHNLSVSELTGHASGWRSHSLLQIPEPVAEATASFAKTTPLTGTRSVG
jgi:broad specificity phosphatase PhoE